MGLILDSTVLIAAERKRDTVESLLKRIVLFAGDQETAVSSVGLTEIVHGVHRASNAEIRQQRQGFLDDLLRGLTIYPYTTECALMAGRLNGELQAKGIVVPFVDLMIGATALVLNFQVMTANARHFRLIPDLSVLLF